MKQEVSFDTGQRRFNRLVRLMAALGIFFWQHRTGGMRLKIVGLCKTGTVADG